MNTLEVSNKILDTISRLENSLKCSICDEILFFRNSIGLLPCGHFICMSEEGNSCSIDESNHYDRHNPSMKLTCRMCNRKCKEKDVRKAIVLDNILSSIRSVKASIKLTTLSQHHCDIKSSDLTLSSRNIESPLETSCFPHLTSRSSHDSHQSHHNDSYDNGKENIQALDKLLQDSPQSPSNSILPYQSSQSLIPSFENNSSSLRVGTYSDIHEDSIPYYPPTSSIETKDRVENILNQLTAESLSSGSMLFEDIIFPSEAIRQNISTFGTITNATSSSQNSHRSYGNKNHNNNNDNNNNNSDGYDNSDKSRNDNSSNNSNENDDDWVEKYYLTQSNALSQSKAQIPLTSPLKKGLILFSQVMESGGTEEDNENDENGSDDDDDDDDDDGDGSMVSNGLHDTISYDRNGKSNDEIPKTLLSSKPSSPSNQNSNQNAEHSISMKPTRFILVEDTCSMDESSYDYYDNMQYYQSNEKNCNFLFTQTENDDDNEMDTKKDKKDGIVDVSTYISASDNNSITHHKLSSSDIMISEPVYISIYDNPHSPISSQTKQPSPSYSYSSHSISLEKQKDVFVLPTSTPSKITNTSISSLNKLSSPIVSSRSNHASIKPDLTSYRNQITIDPRDSCGDILGEIYQKSKSLRMSLLNTSISTPINQSTGVTSSLSKQKDNNQIVGSDIFENQSSPHLSSQVMNLCHLDNKNDDNKNDDNKNDDNKNDDNKNDSHSNNRSNSNSNNNNSYHPNSSSKRKINEIGKDVSLLHSYSKKFSYTPTFQVQSQSNIITTIPFQSSISDPVNMLIPLSNCKNELEESMIQIPANPFKIQKSKQNTENNVALSKRSYPEVNSFPKIDGTKVVIWSLGNLSIETSDMILSLETKGCIKYRGTINFEDCIKQRKNDDILNIYQGKVLIIDKTTNKLGYSFVDRTVKYLMAICSGMKILDSIWLKDSMKTNSLIDFSNYEISGCNKDTILGGPAKARKAMEENGSIDLLSSYDFVLIVGDSNRIQDGKKTQLNEEVMTWMILKCGGRVIASYPNLVDDNIVRNDFILKSDRRVVILSLKDKMKITSHIQIRKDDGEDNNNHQVEDERRVLVSDWLLDSISQQSIPKDTFKYYADVE